MNNESKTDERSRGFNGDELSESGLEMVSGGFNPQPEPPGKPNPGVLAGLPFRLVNVSALNSAFRVR